MAAARATREVARQAKRAAVLETRRVAAKLARDLLKREEANRYAMRTDMTEVELLAVLECDGIDLDEMFADSDRDLAKALMLYYINSGYLSFDNHREYMSSYSGVPVDVERIVSQVKQERLTEGERDTKVFRFYNRHSYTQANLFACSACGYRVREQQTDPELLYKCVDLDSDFMSVLLFTQEQECVFRTERISQELSPLFVPVDDGFNTGPIFPWRAKSVFEASDARLYHLHPELVDEHEDGKSFVRLCPFCYESLEKNKVPRLSLASGVDFGNYKRVGLEQPSLHEELVIAKTRLVISSLKIKSNMCGRVSLDRDVLQCNAVLFCQDNVERVGTMLSGSEMFDEAGLVSLLKFFCWTRRVILIDWLGRRLVGWIFLLVRGWCVSGFCIYLLYTRLTWTKISHRWMKSVLLLRKRIKKSSAILFGLMSRVV
jgi:hypothetical protein